MNSEFGRGPSPEVASHCTCCMGGTTEASEAAFLALDGGTGSDLRARGHQSQHRAASEDFVETIQPAVDMIRMIDSKNVRFLYCAPHTFYFGDDIRAMIREAAPVLAHVHVADTFNHKASSGLRYIVNPPGSKARVHTASRHRPGRGRLGRVLLNLAEVGFDAS